ncbi:diguanylate cyclase, partial [Escherichia coli]|uniref:diguanylate cyclase domain-containing protein n=1 Tax=Escherichia coli TaxID=562 RepID=UPI002738125D
VPLANGGFITIYSNVTERRKSEARILQLAYHDELTQLANRSLFYERLWQALALTGSGELVAVHLIDLDNFKLVNDSLGHAAGDSLIKEAAQRLR